MVDIELKNFKFPRKTSNQEENPHTLKKGDSNIIITQLVNNFNKQVCSFSHNFQLNI